MRIQRDRMISSEEFLEPDRQNAQKIRGAFVIFVESTSC